MVSYGDEDISKSLERARVAWLRAMASHASSPRHVEFPAITMLSDRHLENCKILASRDKIIERMIRHGKVAELGVDRGYFSEIIMKKSDPEKLHLIDMDLSKFDVEKK